MSNKTSPLASVFGRVIYAEFLRVGISGMPDVHGVPAREVDASSPRLVDRLPKDYGDAFGAQALKLLRSCGLSAEEAEEALCEFQLAFLSGEAAKVEPGHALSSATFFVLTGLKNHASNAKEKRNRRAKYHGKAKGVDKVADDGAHPADLPITSGQLDKVMGFLGTIHPDLPAYFQISADGATDTDLVEQGLLPNLTARFSGVGSFNNWKRGKMMPQLRAFVDQGG